MFGKKQAVQPPTDELIANLLWTRHVKDMLPMESRGFVNRVGV